MRRVAALGAVQREAIASVARRERERRRRARLAAAMSLNASRGSPLYMDSLKNVICNEIMLIRRLLSEVARGRAAACDAPVCLTVERVRGTKANGRT